MFRAYCFCVAYMFHCLEYEFLVQKAFVGVYVCKTNENQKKE